MARNVTILNHWIGASPRVDETEGREFEKFDTQILNRIRRIAGHKKGIVTPESSILMPERLHRLEMVKMKAPVLLNNRLIVKEAGQGDK